MHLYCFFPNATVLTAQVRINEFLADNIATNPDMYDYDDFIRTFLLALPICTKYLYIHM